MRFFKYKKTRIIILLKCRSCPFVGVFGVSYHYFWPGKLKDWLIPKRVISREIQNSAPKKVDVPQNGDHHRIWKCEKQTNTGPAGTLWPQRFQLLLFFRVKKEEKSYLSGLKCVNDGCFFISFSFVFFISQLELIKGFFSYYKEQFTHKYRFTHPLFLLRRRYFEECWNPKYLLCKSKMEFIFNYHESVTASF